jgi:polar amino acid transport system substrate-binding protein
VTRSLRRTPFQLVGLLAAAATLAAACAGGASTAPSTAPSAPGGSSAAPSEAASAAASAFSVAAPTSLITPGTLTDCVDIEYPPMEYFPSTNVTDPNQAVGFDVDAAKAVAASFGLPLTVRNVGFDGLIPDLTAGRCDIVWTALYVSSKRTAVADAVPYMATGWVLMVPNGNPKAIASPDDLCGKTISIQTGGLVEQAANDQSKKCTDAGKTAITIQGYPKVPDELQQIVLGRVDAVWETDSAVSDFMLKNAGKYQVAYAFPRTDTYGVYLQQNKPDLKTALTAAIAGLKANGTLAALAQQYQIDPATLEAIK